MMKLRKLTRNWRKSSEDNKFTLPTLDDSRPMDTQEQEELIRSFEKSQAQQSLVWRSVFAAFLFCFALFLVYSIFQQALSPWELRYHAYFMEEIDSQMIIAAGCIYLDYLMHGWVTSCLNIEHLSVLVCSTVIIGLFHDSNYRRQLIWYSCFAGMILAVFWLYYMLRLPKFRWDVIWLPFGPLGGAGMSLYVDHLLNESSEEIRKLRGYMYAYKDIVRSKSDRDEKGMSIHAIML